MKAEKNELLTSLRNAFFRLVEPTDDSASHGPKVDHFLALWRRATPFLAPGADASARRALARFVEDTADDMSWACTYLWRYHHQAIESLHCTLGRSDWLELCWRYSTGRALHDAYGPTGALLGWLEFSEHDEWLDELREQASAVGPVDADAVPPHLPASHWWWWYPAAAPPDRWCPRPRPRPLGAPAQHALSALEREVLELVRRGLGSGGIQSQLAAAVGNDS